jgi:hypothetical protein
MLRTAVLLTISNVFMTFAWYGHLRHTSRALWIVVLASWAVALLEYCFQVPANRIGYAAGLSGAQLKTLQEVITLVVFVVFARFYLNEALRWNVAAGFVLVALGAGLVFAPWQRPQVAEPGIAEVREPPGPRVAEAGPGACRDRSVHGEPHPASVAPSGVRPRARVLSGAATTSRSPGCT